MNRVFFAETDGLPDPAQVVSLMKLVSFRRRENVLLARQEKRRDKFGAELLLSYVLSGVGKSTDDIEYGVCGKPMIDGLNFNLSHSDGGVAVAISDFPVGCDVEKVRAYPRRVAEKFTADERKRLENTAENDRDAAFFCLWTAKESYLKMTGEGLSAFSTIEINYPWVLRAGVRQDCKLCCAVLGNYILTTCGKGETFERETVDLRRLL